MKLNIVSASVATIITFLLAWFLWLMGVGDLQKSMLAFLGGILIEIGFLGGFGVVYENPRSGKQVRLVCMALAVIVFLLSCIYSFFPSSVPAYCIPVGLISISLLFVAYKVYSTKQ